MSDAPSVYPFRFDPRYRAVARVFGITDRTAAVRLDDGGLSVRFGPWRVRTPIGNIADVSAAGPYRVWRTIGPARLGVTDRSLSFATNPERGALLTFVEPIRGIDPRGWIRHPSLTLTVADVDALVADLSQQLSAQS